MADKLDITIQARLSELRNLAELVESFGEAHDLSMKMNFMINLALEELITNTVIHGEFGDIVEPKIGICLYVEKQTVVLVVESDGQKFDPTQETNPDLTSELDARPIGGLGLHLIKQQANRVSYAFVNNRNRLQLEYDLAHETA